MDKGAAEAELLFHAAGEFARRAVEERLHAGGLGELVDAAAAFVRAVAEEAAEVLEVLLDRQGRVEVFAKALGHVGDFRQRGDTVLFVGDIAAEDGDRPVLHHPRAGDERQQTRLADAVGPDHAGDFPGGEFNRHVVDSQGVAVVECDVRDADDTFVGLVEAGGIGHGLFPLPGNADGGRLDCGRRGRRGRRDGLQRRGRGRGQRCRRGRRRHCLVPVGVADHEGVGPGFVGVEAHPGHAGQAGLDQFLVVAKEVAIHLGLDAEHEFCRSVSVSTVLGVNCAVSAT